jgi:hypothetical protein
MAITALTSLALARRRSSEWNVPDFIDTGLGCQVGEFSES